MRFAFSVTISALLLASAPASATGDFEGILHMKMTMKHADGKIRFKIGKPGIRSETEMMMKAMGGMTVNVGLLYRLDSPGKAYMISDAEKSYTEVDIEQQKKKVQTKKSYTVKKLGTEKVQGYTCKHVLVTEENGSQTELWTNKGIFDASHLMKVMGSGGPGADDNLMAALKKAGVDGFFVKMVRKNPGRPDDGATMELVKVEPKKMPKSTFDVPKGYKKRDPFANRRGPPPTAEQMKKAMEKMTPEQRKMLQEAMKRQAAGQK